MFAFGFGFGGGTALPPPGVPPAGNVWITYTDPSTGQVLYLTDSSGNYVYMPTS